MESLGVAVLVFLFYMTLQSTSGDSSKSNSTVQQTQQAASQTPDFSPNSVDQQLNQTAPADGQINLPARFTGRYASSWSEYNRRIKVESNRVDSNRIYSNRIYSNRIGMLDQSNDQLVQEATVQQAGNWQRLAPRSGY